MLPQELQALLGTQVQWTSKPRPAAMGQAPNMLKLSNPRSHHTTAFGPELRSNSTTHAILLHICI